jgi:hypothetical protein
MNQQQDTTKPQSGTEPSKTPETLQSFEEWFQKVEGRKLSQAEKEELAYQEKVRPGLSHQQKNLWLAQAQTLGEL